MSSLNTGHKDDWVYSIKTETTDSLFVSLGLSPESGKLLDEENTKGRTGKGASVIFF